jgi:23S rRNA (adenine1618-N6)-methyltransferase
MCNPPFYNSQEEIEALRQKKDTPPEGACTGSEVEMIYPGGEVGFIEKMMRDSLIIGSQTRYGFSALLFHLIFQIGPSF